MARAMPKTVYFLSRSQDGKNDIPCDDGCNRTGLQKDNHGNTSQDKNKLNFIVFPGKVIELEGEHGNLRYQKETGYQHEHEKEEGIKLF